MDKQYEKIFNQKAEYLEKAILALQDYYNSSVFSGLSKPKWIANISLYALLLEYDLWIYMCNYDYSNRKFVKTSFARSTCVAIVESTEDILQLMGKEYQDFYSSVIDVESLCKSALNLRKKIVIFKNENEKQFRDIRNYTLAHRENNVIKQVEILTKINVHQLMDKCMSYLNLIEELHLILNDSIKYISLKMSENDYNFIEKLK